MRTIVAASIGMALAAVVASTASAQMPAQDSVTGSFKTGNERSEFVFTFDVRSGPSGENPTGTVGLYSIGAGDLGAFAVSCLGVSGNRATLVAPLLVTPPGPAAIVIHVEDNGTSGDRVDWSFVSPLPTVCPPPITVSENVEPSRDVTVVDAQPFPATRDQCKHGGWRSYGIFKNQGACVAFVIREAVQACVFEQAAIGRTAFRSKYGGGRFDLFAMLHCIARYVDG